MEEVEEEEEVEVEPSLQFAKCRAGIQLYREMSLVTRKEVRPRPRPVSRQECEEDISHLSHLVTIMASMRMDDQRCALDTLDTSSSLDTLDTSRSLDTLDNKARKKSARAKMVGAGCSRASRASSATSYRSYEETRLELESKKLPLPQILLLPTSQWRIHQAPPDEGSGNIDDLSISHSFISSSSNYG